VIAIGIAQFKQVLPNDIEAYEEACLIRKVI